MAVSLMTAKVDPDSVLTRPSATVKLVRLIGPIPPNSIKLLCKPQPEEYSTSPYGLKANAACAVEEHHDVLIPFTSYSLDPNSIPTFAPPYTLTNPSPHHSFTSNDSTSFCDDPSPVPLSTSPASCIDDLLAPEVDMPDPIGELMNLDFPDIDCSDLLCDDQFWDLPDFKTQDMSQILLPPFSDDSSSICCSARSGYSSKVGEVRGDRQAKKRNSNRQAALRYRERKRLKKQGFDSMLDDVRREHDCLRAQLMAEYQSASLLIELAKGMV